MNNSTPMFRTHANKIYFPALVLLLSIGILIYSSSPTLAQQGVTPTLEPSGGFAIDGNLLSRTPTTAPFSPDNGDFLPNEGAPGTGGFVFTLDGMPVDTTMAYHIIDGYDAADANIFTGGSKFNNDPNTWVWKSGKPPAKDDMNNVMFFFSLDSLGNTWFIGSGDRKKTNGNTYLDFELLQNPLYKNQDNTFTSLGPDGGRTIGDLALTIIYTNGGSNPQLLVYQWDSTGQGNYAYELINPAVGTTFLATNNDGAIAVPYGAFGANTYQESAFTEVACNLNELISGSYSCLNIETVIVKTKASQSINAALKDFINPVQVNINSTPEISVNSPTICFGDSATLTATILSGNGPFSYLWSTGDTTESITVSPDTSTTYTVVVTGINGCPSNPATSNVTVIPLPVCFISGPDTLCPLGLEQYTGPDSLASYAWSIYGSGMINGDTSAQVVMVEGMGACDTSFTLTLTVAGPDGCSSTCSKTVYLVDTINPVFTYVPDSLMIECASEVPLASPDSVIVADNCAGNLTIMVSDSITNDSCHNQFTVTRTWTATDTCGNSSFATQIINVLDTISPILYGIPADTGVCCPDSIPLPAYVTAIDNCDGELPVILEEIVSDSTGPNYFTLTRTWTATDTCSNMISASQVIEVNDTLYGGNTNVSINNPDGEKILYFKVSPNPFSTSTNVQFSLAQDTYVSLELYNYTGIKLRSLYSSEISAGSDISVRLSSVSSMEAGIYFLVLRTNQAIETRRIILTR